MTELIFSCIVIFLWIVGFGISMWNSTIKETNLRSLGIEIFSIIVMQILLLLAGWYNDINWPQIIHLILFPLLFLVNLIGILVDYEEDSRQKESANYLGSIIGFIGGGIIFYFGGLFDFILN